jgi:hypothetical protein
MTRGAHSFITKKQEGFTKDTKQNKILRFARSQIEVGARSAQIVLRELRESFLLLRDETNRLVMAQVHHHGTNRRSPIPAAAHPYGSQAAQPSRTG